MKPLPLLIAAALISTATSALTALVLDGRASEPASRDAAARDELGAELHELRLELRDQATRVGELARSAELRAPDAGRAEVGAVGAAVLAWLEENRAQVALALEATAAERGGARAAVSPKAPPRDLVATIERLLDPQLDELAKDELWRELREEGRLDEVVAWFEERAQRDPSDPELQVDLAYAYVQQIVEAGNTPLAGMWATRADQAFDRALELDPAHWRARFSKAVGLSFWPPIFGKQAEAVAQFETLISQQELVPPQPGHAQTYALLGNLYQQQGNAAKAIETWQKGLVLFPNDADLAAKLALAQGQ